MNETMLLTTTVTAATLAGVALGALSMRLILFVTFRLVEAGRGARLPSDRPD
ncbi:MAG: hypothetical protein PVF68_13955 [Acidobacteriota bacterium]|jgi:hypothetical protein